ncbi:MAG: hypothetical protein HQL73_02015 [Magnetococcales bacterium]|nr:hypothetical protein [Magnetococcales bacterium]
MFKNRIFSTIENIYDSVADSGKWERILMDVATLLNAESSLMAHFDQDNPLFNISLQHGAGDRMKFDQELEKKFHSMIAENPRVVVCNSSTGKPATCRMGLTGEALSHDSNVCQEILRHSKTKYALIITLRDNNNKTMMGIGVFRTPNGLPFNQEAIDAMGKIAPHFQRALSLHKRLVTSDLNQRVAMSALDETAMGIFIVNDSGQILFANDSATHLINMRDGLISQGGHLLIQDSKENSLMQQHIWKVINPTCQTSPKPIVSKSLSVRRRQVEEPLLVMISSLASHKNPSLGRESEQHPLAVIYVTDPLVPQEVPPELLQGMFGLTRREADLAGQLTLGNSLSEGAERLGMTENTARTHLKAIFDKTNTQRQSDLVRLILSSPLWIRKATGSENQWPGPVIPELGTRFQIDR